MAPIMTHQLDKKIEEFLDLTIKDPGWNINDELLFQVLSYTLYGYAFGFGRLTLMMEPEEINLSVVNRLISLGAGQQYVEGLVESAYSTFLASSKTTESKLVGIGHSHFTSKDLTECINSIFSNVESLKLKSSNATPTPWWKFW
jgi:hypothetical protein